MDQKPLKFRTIILSDVHLGTHDCKIAEVNHFIKHTQSQKFILNGDIIDGWKLKQGGHWPKTHTRFIRLILKNWRRKTPRSFTCAATTTTCSPSSSRWPSRTS